MSTKRISMAVIRRLPKYYRYLNELHDQNIPRISSKLLADEMGFTASQIRQDLNCFGGFGQQGYGYNVEKLRSEIADILGLHNHFKAILLGTGNLGRALLNNFNFQRCGFDLIAAFDISPEAIGTRINGIPVLSPADLEAFIAEHRPELAVLTLPSTETPEIAPKLEALGIKGIWNFTNVELRAENTAMKIENVHFTDSLMTLCYQINE